MNFRDKEKKNFRKPLSDVREEMNLKVIISNDMKSSQQNRAAAQKPKIVRIHRENPSLQNVIN